MESGSTPMVGLVTLVLPVFLLIGCGGDGVGRQDSRTHLPVDDPALDPLTAQQRSVSGDDQVQEAVRDLGLVDPVQDVRLDAASAEFGLLSVEQLNIALLDENPSVRQAAVDALLGEPETIVMERLALLTFAMTDPDEAVRESVVAVLGTSNDPRSIALLLKARGDESVVVREEAREALSTLRATPDGAESKSPQSGD